VIRAVFYTMATRLLRDRGALALAFLLPPLIFVIFAAIFAGTSGRDLQLRVGWADQVDSQRTQRLREALAADDGLELVEISGPASLAAARERVRSGAVDAAVVVTAPLGRMEGGRAPLHILADGSRAMAAPMVAGRVRQTVGQALPRVAMARTVGLVEAVAGSLTEEQQLRLAEAEPDEVEAAPLLRTEVLSGRGGASGVVRYYAGAVALLFLLFSAMQGAAGVIDERRSGIVDRLLLGPAGTGAVLAGKWAFLTLQGALQVALIFAVAWLGYGVDWPGRLGLWGVTTLTAAAAAAGLALALTAVCSTRQQAHTLTTFTVLILSAVGGSMVPRFMMPDWLRDLGWLTPNAWAIEAYQGVFWRGQGVAELWPAWAVLLGIAAGGLLVAWPVAIRWSRTT
jgi:ABC-2 type transport system permease protein